MQKVVGSNPISRLENPRICGGFLVTGPDRRLMRKIRVNRLGSGGQRSGGGTARDWAAFAPKEACCRHPPECCWSSISVAIGTLSESPTFTRKRPSRMTALGAGTWGTVAACLTKHPLARSTYAPPK